MQRRKFIERLSTGSALMATTQFPLHALGNEPEFAHLSILHTNDVHSRIDPFPMDGSRNEGLGGAAKRAALISKIRQEKDHVLLVDSGDVFQGTPYFNFFGGELEFKLMSKMGYDVGTMGNHDFDAGIEGFEKQLVHANFPFVVANYDFKNTILENTIDKAKIFHKGELKIGVFGLGIKLKGLVAEKLYADTQYLDPIKEAQKVASSLKHDHHCDLVICLSHLGYKYDSGRVCDVSLAQSTHDIDIILGGHTHTFMKQADIYRNIKGKEVAISQAGWAGIMLGRIDLVFEKTRGGKCISCKNSMVN